MASKIKVDQIQTADGTGTIALQNQLSGMTTASLPTITTDKLGTGAILQVVTDIHVSGSHHSTSSTSYIDSQLSASITPKFSNSKIIIVVNLGVQAPDQGYAWARVLRDASALNSTWEDTPSSTSACTYKIQVKTQSTAGYYYHHAGIPSSLTLMEIKV
jgi:hypothetical protein